MNTIFKYPLKNVHVNEIDMPRGAKVLSVQVQRETICLWALVDPEKSTEKRRFAILGTGQETELDATGFIGTVQLKIGVLVFHVFELRY